MAYTPINWQTGDTITAEKLNKMDNGWGVEYAPLASETVTTAEADGLIGAPLTYSTLIDSDAIKVTFNGTEYTCEKIVDQTTNLYGGIGETGPDFTEYPFAIESYDGHNIIYTETAGTYTVSISASQIEVSNNFKIAANDAVDTSMMPFLLVQGVTTIWEATKAITDGRLVYYSGEFNSSMISFIVTQVSVTCTIIPESSSFSARFGRDDGLFYIQSLTT